MKDKIGKGKSNPNSCIFFILAEIRGHLRVVFALFFIVITLVMNNGFYEILILIRNTKIRFFYEILILIRNTEIIFLWISNYNKLNKPCLSF